MTQGRRHLDRRDHAVLALVACRDGADLDPARLARIRNERNRLLRIRCKGSVPASGGIDAGPSCLQPSLDVDVIAARADAGAERGPITRKHARRSIAAHFDRQRGADRRLGQRERVGIIVRPGEDAPACEVVRQSDVE